MMDTSGETLYWTISQGQRRQIASEFGVCRAADGGLPDDLNRAAHWLDRLRQRGSLAAALRRAASLHWYELRRIEDAIRDDRNPAAWRAALEDYRELSYRLLALAGSRDGDTDERTSRPAGV